VGRRIAYVIDREQENWAAAKAAGLVSGKPQPRFHPLSKADASAWVQLWSAVAWGDPEAITAASEWQDADPDMCSTSVAYYEKVRQDTQQMVTKSQSVSGSRLAADDVKYLRSVAAHSADAAMRDRALQRLGDAGYGG